MNFSLFSFLNQIQSLFSQAETPMTDATWQEIPETVRVELEKLITQLPHPSSQITTIEREVISRLKEWEADKYANHLVILGSPVSHLEGLIQASFPQHYLKEIEVIYPFSDLSFRKQPDQITQQLKTAIESTTQGHDSRLFQLSQESKSKIIIIPNLEQCFLRCIGGWEGIIWLREHIVHTPDCFWLLGCNHWSWSFLDYVCQINAYLEAKINLPNLDSDKLWEWLQPIVESFIPEEKEKKSSFFWETLASLSGGESEVAMALWLESLQMSVDEEDQDNEEEVTHLKLKTPSLPKLEILSAEDRYVLHSLLLHGKMTRSSLAMSLGEKQENIQARIQVLLRDNLIEKRNSFLSITPLYYPKIKQELSQNNFLIGET